MGASSEFNTDILIKGDLNIYICGKINNNNNKQTEDVTNYNVLKNIFSKFMNNGKIKSNNNMDKIYSYEYRKLDKKIGENKERKKYNAFLFFNEVDEIFSKILIEEHLYEMDKKNENKNVIIYFGEDEYIKDSFDKLYQKSPESLPFLIIVKNTSIYCEKLKLVNYIPNIISIRDLLMFRPQNIRNEEIKSMIEKALFHLIKLKIYRIDMYYNQLGYNLNLLNPLNDINSKIKVNLTIGLLGYSGSGKSTLINLLFNDFVSRASESKNEITTKCSEYYLPIQVDSDNVGQIRFLDFPGINNEKNYYDIIKPELEKKIEEYKSNKEQIDLVLFYLPRNNEENEEELNDASLKLINLLHSNKIKIIFIINEKIKQLNKLNTKKINLKNKINNNEIINDDFSNILNTNYFQNYNNKRSKIGIPLILEKIIDIIKIQDQNFNIEDITVHNYNQKLEDLKNLTRFFDLFGSMSDLRDSIRTKSNLVVTGFSLLSLGTSALSILLPLLDTATTIGYQVAMVYSIFSLYQLDTREYKIKEIILSGGETIELENNFRPNEGYDILTKENIGKAVLGTASFLGKQGIQNMAKKEAGKIIVEKGLQKVTAESVKLAAIKVTSETFEATMAQATKVAISNTVEKIAVNSANELVKQGFKEGTKIAIEASKQTAIAVSKQGAETALFYGSRESIKSVTESIIIKQGGKAWIVNFGKAVPFIGAAISAFMNTYATATIGNRLVKKFDEEFENNKQRKVNVLKGRILGIYNIIEQLKYLIEKNKK